MDERLPVFSQTHNNRGSRIFRDMSLKAGDFVKILKNGEFFKIVQIKKIYGDCIETSHGIYNRTTLASRLDKECLISGTVSWEDKNGMDQLDRNLS